MNDKSSKLGVAESWILLLLTEKRGAGHLDLPRLPFLLWRMGTPPPFPEACREGFEESVARVEVLWTCEALVTITHWSILKSIF